MTKQNFFLAILLAATLSVLAFFPSSALAAIVEGDEIVRYVDTPTGTILYKGTAIDTAPVPAEGESVDNYIPQGQSGLSNKPKKESAVSTEIPEVPNFEAEVEAPVQKHKNNNVLFLVIGAIIIIIGVGIILFIAKSREKE